MKNIRLMCVVALLSGLASGTVVEAQQDAQSLQTIKTFRNTSGASIPSGTALIFSFTSSSTTTGASKGAASTIGMDVTTTTVANDRRFIGVSVSDSSADGTLLNVVTEGPALARFACGTQNTYGSNGSGDTTGTSTVAGQLGTGRRAGWILSGPVAGPQTAGGAGVNSDNCLRWVYVQPEPSGQLSSNPAN